MTSIKYQNKCSNNLKESGNNKRPPPKTNAERVREYKKRKREREQALSSGKKERPPPKTNAERVREYKIRKREREEALSIVKKQKPPPKTNAERVREYKKRKREREQQQLGGKKKRPLPKTNAERVRQYRERKREERQLQLAVNNGHFLKEFLDNKFGSVCNVCDRLCFESDLVQPPQKGSPVLRICNTCSMSEGKIPQKLNSSNDFVYTPKPTNLRPLDPVSECLFSPILPFDVNSSILQVHSGLSNNEIEKQNSETKSESENPVTKINDKIL